jgi:hypothetical protein
LKEKLLEMTSELSATKSQLAQARVQQEALVSSLKEERASKSYRKDMMRETNKESFRPIKTDHSSFTGLKKSSDSREYENIQETKTIASQNSWAGNLEITVHSKGVDKMKPPSRRTPEVSQPLTSTPTKDSRLESFKTENVLREGSSEEAVGFDKSVLENSKDTATEDLTKDKVDKQLNNRELQYDISDKEDKDMAGNDTSDAHSEHSNKRDSGIILDSPSTT